MLRRTYTITGTVQGVGFRPTLYRLAREAGLGGWIQNRSGSVVLALEGEPSAIDAFIAGLPFAIPSCTSITNGQPAYHSESGGYVPSTRHSPSGMRISITSIRLRSQCIIDEDGISPFHIKESGFDPQAEVTIPADLAICPECRSEVLGPENRRYLYPFTTCTNCGPRYSVVHGMPYDRSRTTLNAFPLCEACDREYHDPTNRRFHAESTACPDCGPKVWFEVDNDTVPSTLNSPPSTLNSQLSTPHLPPSTPHSPLFSARHLLASGGILAVRGMGGFHLAVDATNAAAIAELRRRKHRPDKPFAIMARNVDAVRRICQLSATEADLLQSPEAPIVILNLKLQTADHRPHTTEPPHSTSHLSPPTSHLPLPTSHISPDTHTLGVMLPTTPLHLLLHEGDPEDPTPPFDFLLMTSGNQNSEPICIGNEEALSRLHGIADGFLLHDREINLRCDDSLVVEQASGPQVWRRARGYAPHYIAIPQRLSACVLAMGAELKNAIAVGRDERVTLSPHIGDLSTPEARDAHERVAKALPEFLDKRPERIAVDFHPDMHCTRHGERIAADLGIRAVPVQHHHAHGAACLAEHGKSAGLALVFDGTGLGMDGNIWGAELLHINGPHFTRLATFAPTQLPGSDMAVAEPKRQLVARWHAAGIDPTSDALQRCSISHDQRNVWTQQCTQSINAPLTHAAGRLFDSFAALLGIAPARMHYEGQAPIRLEAAALASTSSKSLPFDRSIQDGLMVIDWSPAFDALTQKHTHVWQSADAARQVHVAIAEAAAAMAAFGREHTDETVIALSGGVFMNRLLCSLLIPALNALGLTVLTHSRVPPNDGGIALGQAVVAGWS